MQLPSGLLFLTGPWESHTHQVKKNELTFFSLASSISVTGATTARSANLEVPLDSSWLTSAAATGARPTPVYTPILPPKRTCYSDASTYFYKAMCFREFGAISSPGEGLISLS